MVLSIKKQTIRAVCCFTRENHPVRQQVLGLLLHLPSRFGLMDYSENVLDNNIGKILEKQTHYTIVMGDFNAKVGGQTNTSKRATGCFGLGQRNERGDTSVEFFDVPTSGRMGNIKEFQAHEHTISE